MLNVGAWSAALDCVCKKPESSARASRPSGRQHQKKHALDKERTLHVALQRLISKLEADGASVLCIKKPPAAVLQTAKSEVYYTRITDEQPCVVPFPFDRGGFTPRGAQGGVWQGPPAGYPARLGAGWAASGSTAP